MTGSNKPAAAVGRAQNRADNESAEDSRNEAELASQRAKIEARRQNRFSRVAQLLDQQSYVNDWTHPCLVFRGAQTSVSEYYPELKLAIDKFYHVDEHEKALTDFKKEALQKEGIKYAYLTPDIDLADIAEDMGVKLKKDDGAADE